MDSETGSPRSLSPIAPEHSDVEIVSAATVREELATILSRVAFGKCRYVVERHRRGLVAIIPIEDLHLLSRWGPRALAREPSGGKPLR